MNTLHQQVLPLMITASERVKSAFLQGVDMQWKLANNISSALTKTDTETDAFFRKELQALFPDFGFITEENEERVIKEYNWIIDPIDGTTNFSHKISVFGISVALWKQNQPVYAIVSFPMQNEIVHAIHKQGIYINGKKHIPVAQKRPEPFVIYSSNQTMAEKVSVLQAITRVAPFPRDYGSAVFSLTATALGQIDASIMMCVSIWDIAAPLLMAQETGKAYEFFSDPPDVKKPIKDYGMSMIMGEHDLVEKIITSLRGKTLPFIPSAGGERGVGI